MSSKIPKKLREFAYKIETPPDVSILLDEAAERIETLSKENEELLDALSKAGEGENHLRNTIDRINGELRFR